MNISDFINKYYNIIIFKSVYFAILLMGTFFFFLFRYIGIKNKIQREIYKKNFHKLEENED